jgi:hypothetical protein
VELIDISNFACPGCHEPADDGNEGFVHMVDGSPLCMGETEPIELCDSDDRVRGARRHHSHIPRSSMGSRNA